jgi:1,4-alpha-glucan branching enzyme
MTRCTFRLEGVRASSVALVGSFNEWSTTRHLMTWSDGKWETQITLPAGKHDYCFFALEQDQVPRGAVLQMGSSIEVESETEQLIPTREQFFSIGA